MGAPGKPRRWLGGLSRRTGRSFGASFETVGEFLIELAGTAGRGTILLGRTIPQFRHFFGNFDKFLRQLFLAGVSAIPVVTITAAFTGMVIGGQTGEELQKYGMEWVLGPVVGATLCRELGPVLAAVMVAGFVGGGMASVIATMKVNEEIDALEVMSINPLRFLVMPRLAAMMVAVPLLTVYADVVGIFGGAAAVRYQMGIPFSEFFSMLWWGLDVHDVIFGLVKAWVFGVIITVVSCEQGFSASGGAEGVGRATMRSVVYSFLLILAANYLLFNLVYLTIFA